MTDRELLNPHQRQQAGNANEYARVENIKTNRLFQSLGFAEIKKIVEHVTTSIKY